MFQVDFIEKTLYFAMIYDAHETLRESESIKKCKCVSGTRTMQAISNKSMSMSKQSGRIVAGGKNDKTQLLPQYL